MHNWPPQKSGNCSHTMYTHLYTLCQGKLRVYNEKEITFSDTIYITLIYVYTQTVGLNASGCSANILHHPSIPANKITL